MVRVGRIRVRVRVSKAVSDDCISDGGHRTQTTHGWMETATQFLEGMLSLEKVNGYKNYIYTAKKRNDRTGEIHAW